MDYCHVMTFYKFHFYGLRQFALNSSLEPRNHVIWRKYKLTILIVWPRLNILLNSTTHWLWCFVYGVPAVDSAFRCYRLFRIIYLSRIINAKFNHGHLGRTCFAFHDSQTVVGFNFRMLCLYSYHIKCLMKECQVLWGTRVGHWLIWMLNHISLI